MTKHILNRTVHSRFTLINRRILIYRRSPQIGNPHHARSSCSISPSSCIIPDYGQKNGILLKSASSASKSSEKCQKSFSHSGRCSKKRWWFREQVSPSHTQAIFIWMSPDSKDNISVKSSSAAPNAHKTQMETYMSHLRSVSRSKNSSSPPTLNKSPSMLWKVVRMR